MLRLNYRQDNTIKTKFFDSVVEGYQWAIKNVVTEEDRKYYKDCCNKTFEEVGRELEVKNPSFLVIVMRNSMENVAYVEEE